GEHLISHHIEMMPPLGWEPALHGEQIAVTTGVMAKLQDGILARDVPPQLGASKLSAGSLRSHFGDEVGLACWKDIQPKVADSERALRLNERLKAIWPRLKSEIELVRDLPPRSKRLWPRSMRRGAIRRSACPARLSPTRS